MTIFDQLCEGIAELKRNVNEATGQDQNMLIIGEGIAAQLYEASVIPKRGHNPAFNKTMFYWGEMTGVKIWSHIPA